MLCKCSGKYIDIYFILKITCYIFDTEDSDSILTLPCPGQFSVKYKSFFFRNFIASLVLMLERYIRKPFFREQFELLFIKT